MQFVFENIRPQIPVPACVPVLVCVGSDISLIRNNNSGMGTGTHAGTKQHLPYYTLLLYTPVHGILLRIGN